jgi:uncharacterized protein YjbI with pentapeptide repeats
MHVQRLGSLFLLTTITWLGIQSVSPLQAYNPNAVRYLLEYNECPGCDLTGADLSYLDLRRADLRNADLRNANLSYSDLSYADLRGADLRGAITVGTIFDQIVR